jgi:Late embryogenesis abundant protein
MHVIEHQLDLVSEIGLRDLGLSEVRFKVLLEARNPNDVDVPLTNMRAYLELFGTPFATDVVPAGTVYLPRQSSQRVPSGVTRFDAASARLGASKRAAWSGLSCPTAFAAAELGRFEPVDSVSARGQPGGDQAGD